ncbi:MAG: glycosyltransferase family 4 protein [Chloroflexi bacterium]|nr:glycosyltransferase family 4 protein [Chloroflexota bacterium]MQC47856.1 glycosyltransferase family 1 protein [Chloroflexota bacterium]
MKVALVSPYDWKYPGGVNSHVAVLARQLRERGHEALIIAPSSQPLNTPGVITIGRPFPVSASGSVVRIPVNPRLGRQVREVLEREQFDIVHVHEPLMPVLPIQVLRQSRAANPNVVIVGTFHARKDGGNRLYGYGRRLLKRWFREIHGKIAVSPPAAQYVGRYFPGFYNIIPNGIDVPHWENPALEPFDEFDGTVNILYVGRAEKRKGLGVLIRAFGVVNARLPGTRLIIVGPDSRARRRYQSAVERRGNRGITFVDSSEQGVSYDSLPRYHRSSHIFCSPALGHESQGYVLLEGMAAGIPVVASNIDGYASVITHGVDGVLVPPNDPMALADALTELVRDPAMRARLVVSGRSRVEDYAWPRVAQQVISYYERLLLQQRAMQTTRKNRLARMD